MPIKDYSTIAANNTLTPPNGAPEGMAAGLVNNTIRQVMADTRSFYESGGWCDLGHVPTYVSTTSFTIPTDVTAYYTVGRRIRFYGTIMGTFYGYIVSNAYSSPNTTVTVVLDSGALTSNLSRVDLSFFEQLTTGPLRQGGYINMFRNPFMEIAQRGTTASVTAGTSSYSLDGWIVAPTGANVTWQQAGSLTSGTVYAHNSLGLLGASGLSACVVAQSIESAFASQFSGKRVTIQFLIQNQTGAALTPTITTRFPAVSYDNYGSITTDLGVTNLQTIASGATAIVAYTFDTNFLASRGYSVNINFGNQLNGAGKNVYISAADIRYTPDAPVGLNNAPPRPEYRPRGPETAFCQRYYEEGSVYGYNYSSGAANYRAWMYPFKVNKRNTPSIAINTVSISGAGANTPVVEQSSSTFFAGRVTTTSAGSFVLDITFTASSEL